MMISHRAIVETIAGPAEILLKPPITPRLRPIPNPIRTFLRISLPPTLAQENHLESNENLQLKSILLISKSDERMLCRS